ncbi:MAG: hypothetical protein K0S47_989 [Herbinix sp.]|jgi:hypothetical protein|nr:hypothetical protein [Herbinix sp.]
MKKRKLATAILSMLLLITSVFYQVLPVNAEIGVAPSIVVADDDLNLIIVPGETTHISVPIKAEGSYIANPKVTVEGTSTSPFILSQTKMSINNQPVYGFATDVATNVEFDVTVKETASIGIYPITLKAVYYSYINSKEETVSVNVNLQILQEKAPAQLTISSLTYENAIIGGNTNVSFIVKNEGEVAAHSTYLSLNFGETGIAKGYTKSNIKVGDLAAGAEQKITLPLTILPTATAGHKTIAANFKYKDSIGTALTDTYDFSINVQKSDNVPKLEIESVTYGEMKPGDEITLVATISNTGLSRAQEVTVTVDPSSIGPGTFIKNYFTENIPIGSVSQDKKKDVKIPLIVSKEATGGIKTIKINVNYIDAAGVAYTVSSTVYPEVTTPKGTTADGKPNIVINDVSQSPLQPNAGGQLNVSFNLENKSQVDIKEIKVAATNLTADTFIPAGSEPYQYIETLKGGAKKNITIPLTVSEAIAEGLNNLTIKYTYIDANGNPGGDEVVIPVLDVQNDLGSSSKPKLIVSKYTTDVQELRAGSTFNFIFEIYNTHSSVAAKNITITISQENNVFSVTQGSNSFFINKIEAGETVEKTLELRVKSDATTGAYPIEIKIDYEYDGAEPNPQTGVIGESKIEKLNLQAVENSRPVVDNVNVYSYDGNIVVNTTAMLNFEFYNMGKSPLNNVIATVEGDFIKSDGNMYFIGNVAAGEASFVEFEVLPSLEGTAKGVVSITFEDSNGNEVVMTKDFETVVQGEVVWDGGGVVDGGSGEVFNPEVPMTKKEILPVWLFIVIQVVIFIAFIPITRKAIIGVYKMKLRKKEAENL